MKGFHEDYNDSIKPSPNSTRHKLNSQTETIISLKDKIKKLKRMNLNLQSTNSVKTFEESEYKAILLRCIEDIKKDIISRNSKIPNEASNSVFYEKMRLFDKKLL